MQTIVSRPCTQAACAAVLSAVALTAQCQPAWEPGDAIEGVSGEANCVVRWDPDGPGPATPVYAVGGNFSVAGNVVANHIAAFDPLTGSWSALGFGMEPYFANVNALLPLPNGDLVAGGDFLTSGGVTTNGIARWDGTAWQPFAAGLSSDFFSPVEALALLPNGDILAAGSWAISAGDPADCVARWNGTAWTSLGTGLQGRPNSLLVLANGDVLVGGAFGGFSSAPDKVMRFDGTAWSVYASGDPSPLWQVHALAQQANGHVLAAGYFRVLGGVAADYIARFDGTTWAPLGVGTFGEIRALALAPNGDVVVGGQIQLQGFTEVRAARWNGSTWAPLGQNGNGAVNGLAVGTGGEVFAAGSFTQLGGTALAHAGHWDGATWQTLGIGTNGPVHAIAQLPGGDLVAGGEFSRIGGVAANNVARRTASGWVPFGTGCNGPVRALAVLGNGDLVAGGDFTSAGGNAAAHVARWNGAAWSQVGTGTNNTVYALARASDGKLLIGGSFTVPSNGIVGWDGASFLAFGSGVDSVGFNLRTVYAIAPLAGGQFAMGGSFQSVSGFNVPNLARWTGATWSSMGFLPSALVYALAVAPNGDVIIGGDLTFSNSIGAVRSHNGALQPLGFGPDRVVRALAVLPDGDIVAGNNLQTRNLFLWDGTEWTSPGDLPVRGTDAEVLALLALPDGRVALGGRFARAGDQAAASFGIMDSSCPAGATSYGSGCSSSVGTMTLTNDTPPWIGGVFRSTTTGFAPNSFGLWQLGLNQASVPLAGIFPASGPGCTLLNTFDLANDLVFPAAGKVTAQQQFSSDPVFTGLVLYHQVGQIEVDPATFAITRIATSNGLQLTVGAL